MSDKKLLMNPASLELAIDPDPQFVTPESPVRESLKIINRLFDPLCYGYVLVVSESFIQVDRSQQVPDTAQKLPRRSQILGTVTAQDILRVTAEGKNLNNLTTAEVMTPEVISLNQSDQPDIFTVLSLWREYGMTPLLLYDQTEQLLGAIAPESIIGKTLQLQQTLEERTEALETTQAQLEEKILKRRNAEATSQRVQNHLQQQVEQRTVDLKKANELLREDIRRQQEVETALRISELQSRQQAKKLQITIEKLHKSQAKLIQMEKMSGLGQLVAGIAHEINNPINFIYGNITHANVYIKDLLQLLELYQQNYPNPVAEIEELIEEIELDFLMLDMPKLLQSMQTGSERIRHIVESLRNFSRLDEAAVKEVDIHQGIESTLLILQHRLKGKLGKQNIEICKDYGNLPQVECYPSLLNQVFMNLLNNALDALEDRSLPREITIKTSTFTVDGCQLEVNGEQQVSTSYVRIEIADNGRGIDTTVQTRIFEPFFTTKPVGKGTGLGLSVSYQIVVEKHRGRLEVISAPGEGTEFMIEIPIKQQAGYKSLLFNH